MAATTGMLTVQFRRRTGRVGLAVNAVIALAIALVIAMTWRVVSSDAEPASTDRQTATVDTGDVTATVSASGNVEAATTVEASFEGAGGTLTRVYVKPGDKVKRGQLLAEVDKTSARQDLRLAQASLQSAQASYAAVARGRTAAEAAQDATSVASAEQSVRSARVSLSQARASYALTKRQQDAAVARAERQLADASDAEAKAAARSALVAARDARDTALLQGRQQVTSQEQQVRSAELQLRSTRAQVAVSAQGATEDELSSARSQVTSAQVGVEQAKTTLEQTVLRAPAAGTVTAVNGTVGQSSSESASSDSTATDSADSGGSSGFVSITSLDTLQVTAVRRRGRHQRRRARPGRHGHPLSHGTAMTGTVTAIDTIETVTNNVVEYGVTVTCSTDTRASSSADRPGRITTGAKQGVLRVSSSRAHHDRGPHDGDGAQHDGSTDRRGRPPGSQGDGYTEILSGLADGDVVVLPEQRTRRGSPSPAAARRRSRRRTGGPVTGRPAARSTGHRAPRVYQDLRRGRHRGPRPGRGRPARRARRLRRGHGASGSGKSTLMNIIGCLDVGDPRAIPPRRGRRPPARRAASSSWSATARSGSSSRAST